MKKASDPARTKSKRKPPTPEQIAEAEPLKKLFDARIGELGLSQERFGELHEIGGQGMVWQYLNGYTPLNLEAAIKFAAGLGCNVADFSPKLGELLARGRRQDPRLNQYEIPDHMLHQLLGDFQELGRAKRMEILKDLRAAVLSDRVRAKFGGSKEYPTDEETVRALQLTPSRLSPSALRKRAPSHRGQMALFGKKRT